MAAAAGGGAQWRETRHWAQGVCLNPLGLFQCTSLPCIRSILSACRTLGTPWLEGPISPRRAVRAGRGGGHGRGGGAAGARARPAALKILRPI